MEYALAENNNIFWREMSYADRKLLFSAVRRRRSESNTQSQSFIRAYGASVGNNFNAGVPTLVDLDFEVESDPSDIEKRHFFRASGVISTLRQQNVKKRAE